MARESSIHINTKGLRELIRDLREIGQIGFETTGKFEAILETMFNQTQDQVHIETGRLKASGFTDTDFDGDTWTGTIGYGGPAGTPAYYAIYELARHGVKDSVGTPHYFFAGLEAYAPAFEAVIDRHFGKLG